MGNNGAARNWERDRRICDAASELIEKNTKLRAVISRLRCSECGDELGEDWAESDGEVVCGFCKNDDGGGAEQ